MRILVVLIILIFCLIPRIKNPKFPFDYRVRNLSILFVHLFSPLVRILKCFGVYKKDLDILNVTLLYWYFQNYSNGGNENNRKWKGS